MLHRVLSGRLSLATVALVAWLVSPMLPGVQADELHLADGSKLVGKITQVTPAEVVVTTDFAGEMKIPAAKVTGMVTDAPVMIETANGERLQGVLQYSPDAGQSIQSQTAGNVKVAPDSMTAWQPGQPAPGSEAQVKALQEELDAATSKWSGRVQAGLDGKTGNTDAINFNARIDLKRESEKDRLYLYGYGKYAQLEGVRSANEIVGGVREEWDLSKKLFIFGAAEAEYDEFENLDLRLTLTGGLGYIFFDDEKQTLKGRIGVGYRHESFDTGTTNDDPVLVLGIDYRRQIAPWLLFTHSATFTPTLSDPANDWLLTLETAGEIPLGDSRTWKIRAGMRNDYNNNPQPGIKELDTTYFVNLVWDFK